MELPLKLANYSVRQFSLIVPTGLTQILPQNEDRVSILMQNRGAGTILLSVGTNSELGSAISFGSNTFLRFHHNQDGALVGQPWSSIATGSATLIVIEVIYKPLKP